MPAVELISTAGTVRVMDNMKIVAYDTETTGFPPAGKIIEFSLCYPDQLLDKTFVLNPMASISQDAAEVNGYTIDKPFGKQTFSEIKSELEAAFREADIILVYHEAFEHGILESEYTRLGEPKPPVEFFDVYKLVKKKLKGHLSSLSLKSVSKYLGYEGDGYHSSLFDSRATMFVYFKLINEPDAIDTSKSIVTVAPSSIEEIISPIKTLRDAVQERVKSINFLVDSEESARRAANTISKLIKVKKLVENSRQQALLPIKSVVLEVESLVRTSMIKPLNEAIKKLTSERNKYVSSIMISEKKEHARRMAEAEEKSQLAYEALIAMGVSHEEASSSSEGVYLAKVCTILPVQDKVQTTVDSGRIIDELKFEIEITDESLVPREYMTPNLKLIEEVVNRDNGEYEIPGVTIIPIVTTTVKAR